MASQFRIFTLVLLACLVGAPYVQAQTPPPELDMAKLSQEASGWLAALIRIDTSNPPGNELTAAKYVAGILEREGIPTEVFESAPGRGIVVARLNAGAMPDPSRALLLLAHTDVVGVQKEKWMVDPFGAVIKDGYLYGRGAIDDKGMVAANLAVLIGLKRAGVRLTRDVIFLAEADEETGGDYGIEFAIDKHWDKIAAGYALNEEGRVIVKEGKTQYVGLQASEKISVNVEVIASGASGHASIPRPDNPVVHLAAAIAKIGTYQRPSHLTTVTRGYFEELSKVTDQELAKWMRALETPERLDLAERRLAEANPIWNSMLRDTVAPTMLQAGFRANVIPSEARATLNVRLIPGDSIDDVLADLQKLVNDPQVRFEATRALRLPAPASSLDSALFRTIGRVTPQVFPGAVVAPMMSTGATDSAPLRLRNVQAYGLLPFPLTEDDLRRMHADDERIPLASFDKGIEFLYRIVKEFASEQP